MAIRCDEFAIISFLSFFVDAFISGTANTAQTITILMRSVKRTIMYIHRSNIHYCEGKSLLSLFTKVCTCTVKFSHEIYRILFSSESSKRAFNEARKIQKIKLEITIDINRYPNIAIQIKRFRKMIFKNLRRTRILNSLHITLHMSMIQFHVIIPSIFHIPRE